MRREDKVVAGAAQIFPMIDNIVYRIYSQNRGIYFNVGRNIWTNSNDRKWC